MSINLSLSNHIALVTGASRKIGIGAAICRLLAQAGANIFFTYYTPYDHQMSWGIHPEEPGQLLEDLRGMGIRAEAGEADLADPATPENLFDQAEAALGPVDILVNNATYDVETDIFGLSAEELDRHYAVNVRGAALMCAEFARRYEGSDILGRAEHSGGSVRSGGRIINIVSGELVGPMKGNLPYAMTKGAVDAMTITLSGELAEKRITVNAINPGPTDTGWMSPEFLEWHNRTGPLGRVGLPQDAARLVLFLASDLGGWVTGQILNSTGGFR